MLEFVPETARTILDVGCGEGSFGAVLKEKLGAEVWGIELLPVEGEVAKTRLDTVLVGEVELLLSSVPDNKFDCIVCNDVLEHLVDPYSVITAFKSKLTKDGVIVFSLPNVRYFSNLKELLVDKDWQYKDEGILDRTHLRFFTKKSIERMFTEFGYEFVKYHGISPLSSWKFSLLNALTLNSLADARYLQNAGTVRVKK